jgi:hypothetical protein
MRSVIYLVTYSLLIVGVPSQGVAEDELPQSDAIPVDLIGQQETQWCWAASAQMIMNSLGKPVEQCEQAKSRFHNLACCPPPGPKDDAYSGCVRGAWPEFYKYGFKFKRTDVGQPNTWLTWDEIRRQISILKSPVAFSWLYADGGPVKGHMMVINGYETIRAGNFLLVEDPLPLKTGTLKKIRYETYVEQRGSYSHWFDYYNIASGSSIPPDNVPGAGPAGDDPTVGPGGSGDPITKSSSGSQEDADISKTNHSSGNIVSGIKAATAVAVAESKPSATLAINSFIELSARDPTNAPGGNFESFEVIKGDVRIGQAIPVVYVGADQLAAGSSGDLSRAIDTNVKTIIYPILLKDKVDSSVTMTKDHDNKWNDTEYGNKEETQLLVYYRQNYSHRYGTPLKNFFEVAITGLGKHYLATKSDQGLILIPIADDSELGIKAGTPQKAERVFDKLAKIVTKSTSN